MGSLSICLIVKDEAQRLPLCLDSLRGLDCELIVVDTGSSDGSAEVARRYGAAVFPFDFTVVDFAAARNLAVERARGRWILMMDADETLESDSFERIRALIAGDENAGYFFERHNPATRDYVVRLFPRRPGYGYRGRVHETVDASILAGGGRLVQTDIRIQHHFSADREARRRKNHWYIGILKEEIAADPDDHSRLDFLAAEYHQLEMFDEAAEVAERIALARPLDARAHLFAGVYHLHYKRDPVRARADFARALELRPGYPEAASFLALACEDSQTKA